MSEPYFLNVKSIQSALFRAGMGKSLRIAMLSVTWYYVTDCMREKLSSLYRIQVPAKPGSGTLKEILSKGR